MVTGIITTFHRDADLVRKAIDSMTTQTVPLLEVLLIDDNENENPLCAQLEELCRSYKNVRYIKQDGNRGGSAARNLGIREAKGKFIAFLDDDDLWLPEKIEKQLSRLMAEDNSTGMVYCPGISRNETTGEEKDRYNWPVLKPVITYQDMLRGDFVGSIYPLVKKECFQKVGGFWEEQPARQDYEMWIRISREYGIVGVPESLFIRIDHDNGQISKNQTKCHKGFINIYKRYKKDIDKDLLAKEHCLRTIAATGKLYHPETVYYCFLWMIAEIRVRLSGARKKEQKVQESGPLG